MLLTDSVIFISNFLSDLSHEVRSSRSLFIYIFYTYACASDQLNLTITELLYDNPGNSGF